MRSFPVSAILLAVISFLSVTARAELLGLPSGRSGDLSKLPDVSVEAGYVTGEVDSLEYSHFGARINYRINPELMIYGDVGQSEVENSDDLGFGIGAFYQLNDLVDFGDSAFKVHYHEVSLDRLDNSDEVKFDIIGVEWVVGGKEPISTNGMHWYANVGIHRGSADGDSDTEFGFGAGVVTPLGSGEAYFGIDNIDDLTFGGGFRYTIR